MKLKFDRRAVVNHAGLARAVETQYGLETGSIDIIKLFDSSAKNGSYIPIWFDGDELDDAQYELDNAVEFHAEWVEESQKRLSVLTYLADVFPDDCMVFAYVWR